MPQQLSSFTPILLLLVMFALMYFMTIRPQKKRMQEVERTRNNLKIGDNVVTIGGIRGKVTSLSDDGFEMETGSDHMRISFLRNAISYVVQPAPEFHEEAATDASVHDPNGPEA